MATTTDLTSLVINYLTYDQYTSELSNGSINENEIYMTSPSNVLRIGNATITYNSTDKRLEIEVL